MMLNFEPGIMSAMDDDHLCTALAAESRPFMTTPAEEELRGRLEYANDRLDEFADLIEQAERFDMTGADVVKLAESHPGDWSQMVEYLEVLAESSVCDADELRKILIAAGALKE